MLIHNSSSPENYRLRSISMAEIKSKEAIEAMDVAEASRETEWEKPSFVGGLFLGNLDTDLIHPFPEQSVADKSEADDSQPARALPRGERRRRQDRCAGRVRLR